MSRRLPVYQRLLNENHQARDRFPRHIVVCPVRVNESCNGQLLVQRFRILLVNFLHVPFSCISARNFFALAKFRPLFSYTGFCLLSPSSKIWMCRLYRNLHLLQFSSLTLVHYRDLIARRWVPTIPRLSCFFKYPMASYEVSSLGLATKSG